MKCTGVLLALIALLVAGCGASSRTVTTLPVVDTGIDPNAWVTIPAGEFLLGPHAHPVMLDDYEIMVTDVTNAQYAAYLNEALATGAVKLDGTDIVGYYLGDEFHGGRHEKRIEAGDWLHVPLGDESTRLLWNGSTVTVKPGYENHPMTMVTWFGAKAYCEFYGGWLPTEMEWEKAARGTDARSFPWGYEIEPNNANFDNSHDPFEGLTGAPSTTPVGFYNGRTHDGYRTLDSASPYGLYDVAGNVWQWTGNVYELTHLRYMRGGSEDNYEYNLRVWRRNSAGPDYAGLDVGFRCIR